MASRLCAALMRRGHCDKCTRGDWRSLVRSAMLHHFFACRFVAHSLKAHPLRVTQIPPRRAARGRCIACAASLLPMLASAQSAEPQRLDPVVVTATRTDQRAFDLPVSIDVVDSAQIQPYQLQENLSESLVRVPGIVAQNRGNYAQDLMISVRGFGARANFGVRGVRLYQDGIPATMPDGQGQTGSFSLVSARRVEVMRGPVFDAVWQCLGRRHRGVHRRRSIAADRAGASRRAAATGRRIRSSRSRGRRPRSTTSLQATFFRSTVIATTARRRVILPTPSCASQSATREP